MTTSTGGGHGGRHHHGAHPPPTFQCSVCRQERPARERTRLDALRTGLSQFIIQRHPDAAAPDALICRSCRDTERLALVTARLEEERGQLTAVEADVARRAAVHSTVAEDLEREFTRNITFGQRAADAVARVGGSWAFVLGGLSVLGVWVLLNSGWSGARPFDPYPFILLNLVLSCVAALQAPIIMVTLSNPTDQRMALFRLRLDGVGGKEHVATLSNPYAAQPEAFPSLNTFSATAGRIYFEQVIGSGGPAPRDIQLWVTDGTKAGTRLLHRPLSLSDEYGSPILAVDSGLAFFAAYDATSGIEPWVTDGTVAGTRPLKDIAPGAGGSYPGNYTLVGANVFFSAFDDTSANQLWKVPLLPGP